MISNSKPWVLFAIFFSQSLPNLYSISWQYQKQESGFLTPISSSWYITTTTIYPVKLLFQWEVNYVLKQQGSYVPVIKLPGENPYSLSIDAIQAWGFVSGSGYHKLPDPSLYMQPLLAPGLQTGCPEIP